MLSILFTRAIFLKIFLKKVMVKLAIIYDLDNTVTQEIEDEKVSGLLPYMMVYVNTVLPAILQNVDEDTFYMGPA